MGLMSQQLEVKPEGERKELECRMFTKLSALLAIALVALVKLRRIDASVDGQRSLKPTDVICGLFCCPTVRQFMMRFLIEASSHEGKILR